jgi:glycosyltransferase involved in cell wall biosynthesis
MPDKIAFVIHGLHVGGAEKFFVDLVNGFHSAGYKPIVIILDDYNSLIKEIHKDIRYILLPRKYKYDFSISLKIRRLLSKNEITKVFCVEGFSFFMAKYLFLFNQKITFYLSLHSTLPISRKRYYLDLVYLRFFQKADKVIFICEYQRRLFKSKYYFVPRNSRVIYNGINSDYFSRSRALQDIEQNNFNWRTQYGIPEHHKVVLMIGRISVEKRHIDAINALKTFHLKFNQSTHLVIVGDGSKEILNEINEALANSGIDNYVHMTGAKNDVRPYLYNANIFTLTSFSETFSIAALEALSMQLPCSLTNVGGAAEMLADGRLGVLSNPRDPESIALSWNILLENMPDPNSIRNYVEDNYTKEKMIANYIEYLSLN